MKALFIFGLLCAAVSLHAQQQQAFWAVNDPYTYLNNIDDITTTTSSVPPGWQQCLGACAGGGSFPPSTLTQTWGSSATTLTFNEPAAADWLDTYKILGGSSRSDHTYDSYIAGLSHWWMQLTFAPDANALLYSQEYEIDNGWFCTTCIGANTSTGTNYMFGLQCKIGTGIQIWDQATGGGWVNSSYSGGIIPCSVGATNTVTLMGHIVVGDQTSCSSGGVTNGFPTDHYDFICWNGLCYVPTNTNTCAGILNGSFATLLFTQVQADTPSGTSSNNASITYSNYNFGRY